MESPLKKRKIASQESQASKVTSTPQREAGNTGEDSPAISRIGEASSISNCSSNEKDTSIRRRLSFSQENCENTDLDSGQSSLLDVLKKNSSLDDDESVVEFGDDNLDYDEFFNKLARFQKKGYAWNLFKPIGKDEGSLYKLILNDPKEAGNRASWFVTYCTNVPQSAAFYLICKFCLDCAGYQKINIRKYFTAPLPPISELINNLMSTIDDPRCNGEVFTTGKFLFADTKPLSKILQKGIFNFFQKFILEAHNRGLLYGEIFIWLLKFLEAMCGAMYRQLMYTAVVFMIKLLTAICMIKSSAPSSSLDNRQILTLDNYINTPYVKAVTACRFPDHECASLKMAFMTELKLWINYSPKIFLDHYNCVSVLGRLVQDEVKSVRLAALEAIQKIVQDEDLSSSLQGGPIHSLVNHVSGRFYDVDIKIALKAMEVYLAMITHHFYVIKESKETFKILVENIYHNDYRMGSSAGKCVINIIDQEKLDDNALLLVICRLAMTFHPNLKPLLVESCIEHAKVLQNWGLIVKIFANPHSQDITVEIKEALSELFLESVHQVLTGVTFKVRQHSRKVIEVDLAQHKLIADEIYPNLKAVLVLTRGEPNIARNILKIVVKVKPEYLSIGHIERAEQFLPFLTKFFKYWTDTDTLSALLDFLVYVNEHIPRISSASRDTIQDLKKDVSEGLYKAFKSRDNETLIMAKKTSIVFGKFDLNENIQWSKLLVSWDIIESNVEYLEDMMTCCHWSIIWKIRKLSSTHSTKPEQDREVSTLTHMSKAFFSNCWELLGHQDCSIKVFERTCETYLAFSQELDNISKQIRTLEELKPSIKDEELQEKITDIFELSVGTCRDSVSQKYAMYIVNMAFLDILPMKCISIVFKYYDDENGSYDKLIENIIAVILDSNDNWIPMLLVNTICICFERLLAKHGVVDVKSREAKNILSLSRKFAACKNLKDPKIASKLLFYAINYAVGTTSYEFLTFVTGFINNTLEDARKQLLDRLKKDVQRSYRKCDPVLNFAEHLGVEPKKKVVASKKQITEGGAAKKPPQLKMKTSKVKKAKGKENVIPRQLSQTTESEVTDDMTIHDSSSDDLEGFLSNLNISK